MVLADDIPDDAGRLLVGLVPVVLELAHGKEHASVNGLQPVADIGQGPSDDHAHGVIEIGFLHLFFDADFRCSFHLNLNPLCSTPPWAWTDDPAPLPPLPAAPGPAQGRSNGERFRYKVGSEGIDAEGR